MIWPAPLVQPPTRLRRPDWVSCPGCGAGGLYEADDCTLRARELLPTPTGCLQVFIVHECQPVRI